MELILAFWLGQVQAPIRPPWAKSVGLVIETVRRDPLLGLIHSNAHVHFASHVRNMRAGQPECLHKCNVNWNAFRLPSECLYDAFQMTLEGLYDAIMMPSCLYDAATTPL